MKGGKSATTGWLAGSFSQNRLEKGFGATAILIYSDVPAGLFGTPTPIFRQPSSLIPVFDIQVTKLTDQGADLLRYFFKKKFSFLFG